MFLRFLFVYGITFLLSSLSLAQNLALEDFQGTYKLKKSLVGRCPKKIVAVVEHFANERAPESFGLYCANIDDCTTKLTRPDGSEEIIIDNILTQLTAINRGPQKDWNENPMFGGYTGYTLSEATLNRNIIQSLSRSYQLNGTLQIKERFYLRLEDKRLHLQLNSENRISGAESTKNIECLYQRPT